MIGPDGAARLKGLNIYAFDGYAMFVPPKNIAGILNNESNLRILEKLKERPYYPRELAAEMGLSEPFVVRRLKAMEEHDIVEGRWESEGTRKVKRYYVKDVTLQLGKDGLKVKSVEKPAASEINLKNEMIGRLSKIPLAILFVVGVVFNFAPLIAILCLLLAWYTMAYYGIYEALKYKTLLISSGISAIATGLLFTLLYLNQMLVPVSGIAVSTTEIVCIVAIFFLAIYQARYYQLELDRMVEDEKEFIEELDHASLYKKILYLPIAIKWQISKYLGLM
jgi:DNA-binding transcriptional ArsR family regulator